MSSNTTRIDVTLVDANVLDDVENLLNALPDTWWITAGWRDGAVEAAGYAAYKADPDHAPEYTNPGNSAHVGANFPDGCARAVDVTLVRDGADVWDFTDPSWLAMRDAVRAHPRLHPGADFQPPSKPDWPHIEKLHWQQDKTST